MTSKSSIFYFETCCFCISLRRGCFIMAYMQLVGIILGTIAAGIVIGFEVDKANEKYQHISSLWIAIFFLLFLTITLALIFNIILLIGLHKNKPGHVKAYLIFNIILSVIFVVVVMLSFITGYTNISEILRKIIQLLISIYYLLVYRSYYIKMKETPEQTA